MAVVISVAQTSASVAYTTISARATIEFKAAQFNQFGTATMASDSWISMYPG